MPPGSSSNVQLRSSCLGAHKPIDRADSGPSSRRIVIARLAQGQAQAAMSRYRQAWTGNPSPSAVIREAM